MANVPGRGYCFVAPVTRNASTSQQAGSRGPVASQALQDLPPKPGRLHRARCRRQCPCRASGGPAVVLTLRGPEGSARQRSPSPLRISWQAISETVSDFLTSAASRTPTLSRSPSRQRSGWSSRPETPRLAWVEALRDRQLLLVFDNCEHVVEAVAGLAEKIHSYAPSVSILATSRESLDAASEFSDRARSARNPAGRPEGCIRN